jgi:hypothetical protein
MPNKEKIFCIGFGKTGTTSLELALKKMGFIMGNQAAAELLAEDWHNKRIDRIVNYCHTADAFQDVPFGMDNLYKELDSNFPNSKFILTIRDDEEQWYNSLIKFHAKLFSEDGESIPTLLELENAIYRYKGWALDMLKYNCDYPRVPLYEKEKYTQSYLKHIDEVTHYFKDRPNDLLILNVSEENSYQKLASFLGIKVNRNANFPWENKT